MKSTKRGASRKRTERPIGKAEALEILQSALAYCQKANLGVTFKETAYGVELYLDACKVEVTGDVARLAVKEA